MRTRPSKWEKDGTGRAPAGTRRWQPLPADDRELKRFLQALGWVYLHLRLRFGLSLFRLAARAHVGVQTLCDLEHAHHAIRGDTEYLVAHALGYEPEQIRRLARRWLRKKMRMVQAVAAILMTHLWLLLDAMPGEFWLLD